MNLNEMNDCGVEKSVAIFPANIRFLTNDALTLVHRLRRWPSFKSALIECLVFARLYILPGVHHYNAFLMIHAIHQIQVLETSDFKHRRRRRKSRM